MKETPLFWPAHIKDGVLYVLNETLIPFEVKYEKVKDTKDAVECIRTMKTRAFGQFLVVLNTFLLELSAIGGSALGGNNASALSQEKILEQLKKTATALNSSRPTFPFSEVTSIVVQWGEAALAQGKDLREFVGRNINGYLMGIRGRRLERVQKIASLIEDGDSILTHCNVSGELAMAAMICKQQKKEIHFFATETRPYMQGAKLTCWELQGAGAKVTLIADNAVGSVMADDLVNKVIVGSDRSCANGDFANKIGTYQIAVLAKEFKIPFYVLLQPSNKIKQGQDIPIEVRDENELLKFNGRKVFRGDVRGFYPGFDVVPNKYVTEAIAINVN